MNLASLAAPLGLELAARSASLIPCWVDGAGVVREFFAVTLPGLRPQIAVALTLTVTGALRTFDLVWLTTRGGPGIATITPSFLLYTKAFSVGDVGAAAAIGVVLAATCLVISLVIVRMLEPER